jgi:hypothetical protein
MNTRNTKRKGTDGKYYSYYEDGSVEPINLRQNDWTTGVDPSFVSSVRMFFRYMWTAIKIIIIFILLCPFLDKLRQSEIVNKTIDVVKEYDIGCKPCFCNITLDSKPQKRTSNMNCDDAKDADLFGL